MGPNQQFDWYKIAEIFGVAMPTLRYFPMLTVQIYLSDVATL